MVANDGRDEARRDTDEVAGVAASTLSAFSCSRFARSASVVRSRSAVSSPPSDVVMNSGGSRSCVARAACVA